MKLTIVYDNTAYRKDLQADWGFAALVEAHGRTILFDTGASGRILLSNLDTLGFDPAAVQDVFISHAHFDHTGGLAAFLERNNAVRVWVPHSFRGVRNAREVIAIDQRRTLYDGLHSTGELDGIEQSLCVATTRGIVIVAGCSHPSMDHIIDAAAHFGNIYGIIGGLHGNRPESLTPFGLICATHCTIHKEGILRRYPERCIAGGAGQVIAIDE